MNKERLKESIKIGTATIAFFWVLVFTTFIAYDNLGLIASMMYLTAASILGASLYFEILEQMIE